MEYGVTVNERRIMPRSTHNMRPLTQAIQLALFRKDKAGTPRLIKLGELIVKLALEGDREMIKLTRDQIDGRVPIIDSEGAEHSDFASMTITKLIDALVDKKLNSAQPKVTDVSVVVENMTKGATERGEST